MKNINMRHIMISGTILLSLAFTINIGIAQSDELVDDTTEETFVDIAPYEGPIGPGSALYGLKIAFEDFGEIFTFNESRRIEKQIEHARSRIAEAKTELRSSNGDYADIAIERYREKSTLLMIQFRKPPEMFQNFSMHRGRLLGISSSWKGFLMITLITRD